MNFEEEEIYLKSPEIGVKKSLNNPRHLDREADQYVSFPHTSFYRD